MNNAFLKIQEFEIFLIPLKWGRQRKVFLLVGVFLLLIYYVFSYFDIICVLFK